MNGVSFIMNTGQIEQNLNSIFANKYSKIQYRAGYNK
jgi:hypothetical protein